jgi:hypothetical protein
LQRYFIAYPVCSSIFTQRQNYTDNGPYLYFSLEISNEILEQNRDYHAKFIVPIIQKKRTKSKTIAGLHLNPAEGTEPEYVAWFVAVTVPAPTVSAGCVPKIVVAVVGVIGWLEMKVEARALGVENGAVMVKGPGVGVKIDWPPLIAFWNFAFSTKFRQV